LLGQLLQKIIQRNKEKGGNKHLLDDNENGAKQIISGKENVFSSVTSLVG